MKAKKEHCPVCELGVLTKRSDTEQQFYRGQVKTMQICYSECDFCEGVILTAEQASKNKAEMQKFIEIVDKQLKEEEQ